MFRLSTLQNERAAVSRLPRTVKRTALGVFIIGLGGFFATPTRAAAVDYVFSPDAEVTFTLQTSPTSPIMHLSTMISGSFTFDSTTCVESNMNVTLSGYFNLDPSNDLYYYSTELAILTGTMVTSADVGAPDILELLPAHYYNYQLDFANTLDSADVALTGFDYASAFGPSIIVTGVTGYVYAAEATLPEPSSLDLVLPALALFAVAKSASRLGKIAKIKRLT